MISRIAPGIVLGSLVFLALDSRSESTAERSAAIYPPQKVPIAFNHSQHLAAGADCLTCHGAARKSMRASDRNLPSHPECEACHDIKKAASGQKTDPPATCQVCHPGFDETVRRTPALLEFPTPNLRFPHKVHVDRKVDCTVCHGEMTDVAIATPRQLPKMGTCLKCHDGKAAPAECKTCHLTQPSGRLTLVFASGLLRPMQGNPLGLDHANRYDFNHSVRSKVNRADCMQCHAESECQTCHNSLQKPLAVHPNDYITLHPVQARMDTPHCASCHRYQSFCAACHERTGVGFDSDPTLRARNVRVHPDYNAWVEDKGPQHHGVQASRDITQCISCHREESCMTCHADADRLGNLRQREINPHPAGFRAICKSLASRNDRPCLKCHTEGSLVSKGCR